MPTTILLAHRGEGAASVAPPNGPMGEARQGD